MTVESLAAWLLATMLSSVPPGHATRPAEASETEEAGRARYASLAHAIAEASLDPGESSLFEESEEGRRRTAALILAISRYESTWRRDVDLGLGAQKNRLYRCVMQIALAEGKTTPEGWSVADLTSSHDKCVRRALHILQRGKRVCKKRGGTSFVNQYASGYCDRGVAAVKKRLDLMQSYLDGTPEPPPPKAEKPRKKAKKVRKPKKPRRLRARGKR